MTTAKPNGNYGIDAPWVPWMWVGYTVLYAAITVAAATVWDAWWWVVALVALATVAFGAGAALYWYASLRGKFILWDRLLKAAELPAGTAALDLGCGHGTVSIMTALRFPDSTVTGIDLWRSTDQSGNSITAAETNATLNGVRDRVRFDTGDMTDLPYPDGSFRLVTAGLAIHNIRGRNKRSQAIVEAVRVLAPDGQILIADIRRAQEYAADLRAAGLTVATFPLGWRGWWSGPWMKTTAVTAIRKPTQPDWHYRCGGEANRRRGNPTNSQVSKAEDLPRCSFVDSPLLSEVVSPDCWCHGVWPGVGASCGQGYEGSVFLSLSLGMGASGQLAERAGRMSATFSKEERAAMRATAAERKAAQAGADLEAACVAAISEMTGTDKNLAETLHRLVKSHTSLRAKTWYGMPAYTNADGKVVVFFSERREVQSAVRDYRVSAGRESR